MALYSKRLLKQLRDARYKSRQRSLKERTVRSRYGPRASESVVWKPGIGYRRRVVWSPRPVVPEPVYSGPKPFYPSFLFPRYPYVPRLSRSGKRKVGFFVERDRVAWADAVSEARDRFLYPFVEFDL